MLSCVTTEQIIQQGSMQKGVYFGHSSNGVTVRNEKFSSASLRVLFGKLRQSLFNFSTFCLSAKMASYGALNKNQQGLNVNHPYAAGDPYYAESTGFITPQQAVKKRGMSNWIKFGVPLLIVVVVAAVLGGVLGSRKPNNDAATSTSGSSSDSVTHGSGAALNLANSPFATATDSKYLEPLYPSTVCTCLL